MSWVAAGVSRSSSSSRCDDVSGSPLEIARDINLLPSSTRDHNPWTCSWHRQCQTGPSERTIGETDKRTDGRSRMPRETLLENAQFDMAKSRIGRRDDIAVGNGVKKRLGVQLSTRACVSEPSMRSTAPRLRSKTYSSEERHSIGQ